MMYNIGDVVKIKEDLILGKTYKNITNNSEDVLSIRMVDFVGKESKVVEIQNGKYLLDISPYHLFTETMLEQLLQ